MSSLSQSSQVLSCNIFTEVYLQCTDVGTLSRYPPLLLAVTWFALGFIVCWLYLTPSRFMLSFFLNTAWLSLHPHSSLCCPTSLLPSSLSLTSAASVPSRLILLSCVYVHCRWLVCHRHVVTARIPSPQRILWSAACSQLSTWYFNFSPIFVSFLC